jgi:hypothetical protein
MIWHPEVYSVSPHTSCPIGYLESRLREDGTQRDCLATFLISAVAVWLTHLRVLRRLNRFSYEETRGGRALRYATWSARLTV